MSGPLQTTFDQYPKHTDSTNYVSTTKRFEHRQLVAGHFVQMGNSGGPNLSIINFSLQGWCFLVPLEIAKGFANLLGRPLYQEALSCNLSWFGGD